MLVELDSRGEMGAVRCEDLDSTLGDSRLVLSSRRSMSAR